MARSLNILLNFFLFEQKVFSLFLKILSLIHANIPHDKNFERLKISHDKISDQSYPKECEITSNLPDRIREDEGDVTLTCTFYEAFPFVSIYLKKCLKNRRPPTGEFLQVMFLFTLFDCNKNWHVK